VTTLKGNSLVSAMRCRLPCRSRRQQKRGSGAFLMDADRINDTAAVVALFIGFTANRTSEWHHCLPDPGFRFATSLTAHGRIGERVLGRPRKRHRGSAFAVVGQGLGLSMVQVIRTFPRDYGTAPSFNRWNPARNRNPRQYPRSTFQLEIIM
jgi:hypothetical protein